MAQKSRRARVDRSEATGYSSAGNQFFDAGHLAREFEYWNAAGLLFVHAGIAFADAVAILRRGEKSTSENHMDALALFSESTAGIDGREHLRRIIDEKNRVAYTGASFRRHDLEKLGTHAKRFRDFAVRVLSA